MPVERETQGAIQPDQTSDNWNSVRVLGVTLSALAIIFDGFDNQALGLAVAGIAREWNIAPSALAPASFMSLAGMTAGTAIAGLLGDRFGRRMMMIASVALFGLFTLTTALAANIESLTLIRFLTGLGLGGAMPNATALAAEFSPTRARPFAVTATIVCVPLGGVLGGMVAADILPTHGWRAMFLVAGAIPCALAFALFVWLPESPSFLKAAAARPKAGSESLPTTREKGANIGQLFAPEFLRDTIGLWAAFFLCLIAVYTTFSWLPATLASAGFDQKTASLGLASFNFGGVAGALLAALFIGRLGSRVTMTSLAAIGAAIAAMTLIAGTENLSRTGLLTILTALGFTVNGVQTTMFALASHVYPSRMRTTGVGAALGFGRVGAMASSLAGVYLLSSGNTVGFFTLLALAMAGSGVALITIGHHIPSHRSAHRMQR
ncbi:MFS transporter [Novosphingobium sediminicola]|uniref:AAHS family 4-hydroxybenzoate transporter-like MFS transporter n=1 Tax=Novosphingobium sediminicola TaxID=563162 RepID=A0A7W6CNR1_9SPHN|nr:AAHS family 4-hydroxybenzoate transporter-like MFS transporter [Novosphingobium sediminicola]